MRPHFNIRRRTWLGNEEQVYNKSFDIKIWAKLLPFLKPYRGRMLTVVAMMLLTAVIDVANPLLLRYAIDHFIMLKTLDGIQTYAAVYLAMILVQVLTVTTFCYTATYMEMFLGRDMKRALFVHLQELSFDYYNATPVGYIMARTMSDTEKIAGTAAWSLVDIFWSSLYVIGSFGVMLALDWKLALLILLIVPLISAATVFFQSRILKANREMRAANSKITGAFNEGIGGARTSKILVIEEENSRTFRGLTHGMYRSSVRSAMLSATFIPIVLLCGSLATAIVLARGGWLTQHGFMEFGTLSAFISYALGIFEPIQQLARIFADFISIQASIERVTDLLERKPNVTDTQTVIAKYGDVFHPKKENWEPLHGDIEFRDVTFHYPDGGENVLEHFSLTVPAGTTVAIVGETGAGKSTIVNLACRFFEPTEGSVLIDGRDYRERSQLWLHSSIGYVLQDPHLFSGSVRENIRYGRLDATDEEVAAAAEMVSADRIVKKLEKGYDSDVGEGGDRLSTGEKQMISFARAVLADPAIFILDEATSSVDTETEQLIQHAIARLLTGRTSFIIAHRLSTIRRADMILVVRDGKIVERGTHRELLHKKGYYYDLYTKQFEEEAWKKAQA
jgi:ATP-binding cassette subfamily B protein